MIETTFVYRKMLAVEPGQGSFILSKLPLPCGRT
jgi:hypothetical protein